MPRFLKLVFLLAIFAVPAVIFQSCSKNDEDVRLPGDILGVWSPADNLYLEYCSDNVVHKLEVEYQDGESIGEWTKDVYYYEPGYNLVVYMAGENKADIYQIVEMNEQSMTWCWVDQVVAESSDTIGQLLGEIIKQAQEGYKLDPALFQSFRRISLDQFFSILESLDIEYPWIF